VRVAIAEDAALFREGIVRLLAEAGMTVTASVGDAISLASTIIDDPPDVVILDVRMPPTHTTEGLDAARAIAYTHPDIGVLLLSQHVETRHVAELMRDHARIGYLLKERVADSGELIGALRRLHAGGSVVDPEVIRILLRQQRHQNRLERLTLREREVLAAMAQGRSNGAIADQLVLTAKTVETHIGRILAKLDLPPVADDNRRVLAVLAHLQVTRQP
jgi:DNA-binding NarL/FixJ family response regulator